MMAAATLTIFREKAPHTLESESINDFAIQQKNNESILSAHVFGNSTEDPAWFIATLELLIFIVRTKISGVERYSSAAGIPVFHESTIQIKSHGTTSCAHFDVLEGAINRQ